MDDLDYYLDVLFDGLEGYVYSPVKTPTSWDQNFFSYPQERPKLIEHIKSQSAIGDVYISPAVYKSKVANKESIKALQCIWVEFDGMEQIKFRNVADPSMIVQTSMSSHVHCYWRTDRLNQQAVEDYNRRLHYYLEADYSGWDATQLLRPPGTFNYKRSLPTSLVLKNQVQYKLDSFDQIPEVPAPQVYLLEEADLLNPHDVLGDHPMSAKLRKMIKKEEPVEPYRSSFLARLANELAEEGLNHAEIVTLLKVADERIGKYKGRSDQLLRLTQLAEYALHKLEADEAIEVYTAEEILSREENLTWIYPGILHTTGQAILSSAPGVGKTQFLCQMAYHLENNLRFLGYQSNQKHKVFFMSLEMRWLEIKYILQHHKNEWEHPAKFKLIDEQSSLVRYEDLIDEHAPTVVMIDSLSEILDNEEKADLEAKKIMRWIRKIRRRYGLAVIIIHHNRKATEGNKKPKNLSDLAGSFIFGKDTDTVLQLWRELDRSGKLKHLELSAVKARYGPNFAFNISRNENLWFTRIDSVSNQAGTDSTDSAGDSEQLPPGDRPGNKLDGPSKGSVSFRFGGKD